MIPRKIFTIFAKFPGIVTVNDLRHPIRAPRTFASSFVFPEKFLFRTGMIASTELPSLAPRQRICDCFAIHFLHWELCDPLWSSRQIVPLLVRLYQCVFCKKTFLIFVLKQISQFGSFGKCVNTQCLPEPGSTFARGSIGNSGEELEVSWSLGAGFLRGSLGKLSSTKFSLNSCSQSGRSRSSSLRSSSSSSFWFVFSVSVGLCSGFPRISSLILPLLSSTGFSVYLLTSNAESCDEDDEEVGVGVVEELVEKPRTTNGTQFYILHSILWPYWVRCGFWPLVQWYV